MPITDELLEYLGEVYSNVSGLELVRGITFERFVHLYMEGKVRLI